MAGSALTFINPAPPAGLDIRGYYQHSNGVPMEICQDQNGPWFAGEHPSHVLFQLTLATQG